MAGDGLRATNDGWRMYGGLCMMDAEGGDGDCDDVDNDAVEDGQD